MEKKHTNFQANTPFIESMDIQGLSSYYIVPCKIRKTSQHMVRQLNTKTTFFYKSNEKK